MDSACLARARHAEGACLALPRRRASARARRSRSSLPAEWARLRSVPQRAAAAADGRRQRLQPLHVRGRLQRRQVRLRIRAKRRLAAPGRPDRAPLRGPWARHPGRRAGCLARRRRLERLTRGCWPPRVLCHPFHKSQLRPAWTVAQHASTGRSGYQGLLPAPAAACLLQQPQQTGQTYLAPCHAPARSHARWHQQPGHDQQGASCGGASQGATSAGAASSTAADRRCQAPALSPPSASALCSAKTCGADTGSAHAVLRGLRTRACHDALSSAAQKQGHCMWCRARQASPEPAPSGGAGRRAGPPAPARWLRQACRARAGATHSTLATHTHRKGLFQQARHAVALRCAEQVLVAWPLRRGGPGRRRRPRVRRHEQLLGRALAVGVVRR